MVVLDVEFKYTLSHASSQNNASNLSRDQDVVPSTLVSSLLIIPFTSILDIARLEAFYKSYKLLDVSLPQSLSLLIRNTTASLQIKTRSLIGNNNGMLFSATRPAFSLIEIFAVDQYHHSILFEGYHQDGENR
jgi:hypothetical protein